MRVAVVRRIEALQLVAVDAVRGGRLAGDRSGGQHHQVQPHRAGGAPAIIDTSTTSALGWKLVFLVAAISTSVRPSSMRASPCTRLAAGGSGDCARFRAALIRRRRGSTRTAKNRSTAPPASAMNRNGLTSAARGGCSACRCRSIAQGNACMSTAPTLMQGPAGRHPRQGQWYQFTLRRACRSWHTQEGERMLGPHGEKRPGYTLANACT